MIYPSVLSAVVAALAAEAMGTATTATWLGSGGSSLPRGMTRQQADCWVHARLHSQLKPRHWNALVARYSTHRGRKVQAIAALVPVVATPAPHLFLAKAVTAWAIPKLKGKEGKRSTDLIVLSDGFYNMNTWDNQGLNRSTYWRWRAGIEVALDECVKVGLQEAERVLHAEGVLFEDPA